MKHTHTKKRVIILAGLLCALSVQAALVEYTCNGKETYIGAGRQVTRTYSGVMIYDTVSSYVTLSLQHGHQFTFRHGDWTLVENLHRNSRIRIRNRHQRVL